MLKQLLIIAVCASLVLGAALPDEVEADWQRPALCSLPTLGAPSGFTCLAFKMMWSYKEDLGMCDAVVYGGCDGTENLFDSEYQCQRKCDRPALLRARAQLTDQSP